MTQSHRLERLRQALYLALWIVPIPFGAFASDQPYFASFSLLVFLLASLSLPQTVRWRQRKRKGTSPYASAGSMLYGSVLVLLVAIGILNGFMPLDWWGNYFCRIAAYFAWMVLTVVVQAFVSWGVEAWQAGLRSAEFLHRDPGRHRLRFPGYYDPDAARLRRLFLSLQEKGL